MCLIFICTKLCSLPNCLTLNGNGSLNFGSSFWIQFYSAANFWLRRKESKVTSKAPIPVMSGGYQTSGDIHEPVDSKLFGYFLHDSLRDLVGGQAFWGPGAHFMLRLCLYVCGC